MPVLAQNAGVEGERDADEEHSGQRPTHEYAPALLANGPQQQGQPEQPGQVGLDRQQGGGCPRGQVVPVADQHEEGHGADEKEGRDLTRDDGEIGRQERAGNHQANQAVRGRSPVVSPQDSGTAGDEGEVEQQPQQMGGPHRQQPQRQDEGQRPGRVPHQDALVGAAGLLLNLVDSLGVIGILAVEEQPGGGPVFDEVVQGQRGQPTLEDQERQGRHQGQTHDGKTQRGGRRLGHADLLFVEQFASLLLQKPQAGSLGHEASIGHPPGADKPDSIAFSGRIDATAAILPICISGPSFPDVAPVITRRHRHRVAGDAIPYRVRSWINGALS
jgi:hypothetical protein